MSTPAPRTMDTARFALADRIASRVTGRTPVDAATREAVSMLTASADPDRADRLAVHPGEPGALVERLAVWALKRVPDDAVVRAGQVLDAASPTPDTPRPAPTSSVVAPAAVREGLQPAC